MEILQRIWWGARWGAAFGLVLCGLALVAFLIGGRATSDALDTSPGSVLMIYLAGGIVCGIMVGAFRPFAMRPAGAGVLGFVGGLLRGALVRVSKYGLHHWTGRDAFLVLMLACVLGIPVGVSYHEIFAAPTKRAGKE